MADDETIVIRVNAAQGEAALRALGEAGIEAGKGIEEVVEPSQKADVSIKDLTKSIGAGISVFGILRENMEALKPILEDNVRLVKAAAISNGADAKTVEGLSLALDTLLHPTHAIANANKAAAAGAQLIQEAWVGQSEVLTNLTPQQEKQASLLAEEIKAQADLVDVRKEGLEALDLRAAALSRELAVQEKSGKVTAFGKDELKKLLDVYYEMRVPIPAIIQEQADRLDVLATSQQRAADTASAAAEKELAARAKVLASLEGDSKEREHSTKVLLEAITAVESHGVVTQEQSAKIQAAVLAETKLYTDYGAVVPAQLQLVIDKYKVLAEQQAKTIKDAEERLSKALSKAGKIDSSQDTSEIEQNLAGINREIKELEGSDIIDAGQQQRLDELKNSALDLKRSMGDLNRAFTVTNESFLTEEEAIEGANAALDVAIAYNEKVRRGMNALQGSAGKVADSFEDIGSSAEDGASKAEESFDNLNAGADEVIPKLQTIKGLLGEIKAEAASIDL